MLGSGRIHDIMIDYRNGTILINGKKVEIPLKVIVKESDGWNISKLFNPEMVKKDANAIYPEVIIDATELQNAVEKQELKKIIKEAIAEIPRQEIKN